MCTVHRATRTVGKIKLNMRASPPRSKRWRRSWRRAVLHPQKPALDELSSCALVSPPPWETLPNAELLEDSSAENLPCFTIPLPAFSHLLLRHLLIARFARVFLLSKNKQANMAQGPNASHEVLRYGLRPLSPTLSLSSLSNI